MGLESGPGSDSDLGERRAYIRFLSKADQISPELYFS